MATLEDIASLENATIDLPALRQETYSEAKSFSYINTSISYKEFFKNYLLPNKPCIFGSWATEGWRSRKEWVEETGIPNISFLEEQFGRAIAPIANCYQEEFSSHPKEDMTVSEYLSYWQSYIQSGYSSHLDCLYLKDWHFTKMFPEYKAYHCPPFFCSDWLNEHWDSLPDQDDYRFIYMGPKGSWTSFHADVFRSYSWSANICGRKKWVFFAPGEEEHLKDMFGNLIFNLDDPQLTDSAKFPNVSKVTRRIEVIQEAGEVIFVPSGWHHQVYNLEDTISINHNWLNACNIDFTWSFLMDSLKGVEREISDCHGMEGWQAQCQLILKASTGINYSGFYQLLSTIAKNRLKSLKSSENERTNEECSSISDVKSANVDLKDCDFEYSLPHLNIHQVLFDLLRIRSLVKNMLLCEEFSVLNKDELGGNPHELLSLITNETAEYLVDIIQND